ncbi:MAG: hypothetical protein RH949_28875 [Coleofasciculus sp. A1-SPW-01]|uniref:hypothetical protein n=1 Tax=Coleofasciculus sp. A1-SPW-01 TaxID=3070819 RepID=UPI0033043A9E
MKIPAVNFDCAYRFNTSTTDLKQVGNAHPTVYSAIAFIREKSVDVARFKNLPYHE